MLAVIAKLFMGIISIYLHIIQICRYYCFTYFENMQSELIFNKLHN